MITAITEIADRNDDHDLRARQIAAFLRANPNHADWIPEEYRECGMECYQARQLHIDTKGRFSICVMAWLPGQTTPVHDHIAWCVVSVCSGIEVEEQFDFNTAQDHGRLRLTNINEMSPGDTTIHWPNEGDIHRVTCGAKPAVSVHIYGTDISVPGTSIRTRFDDLPIVGELTAPLSGGGPMSERFE